MTKGIKMSAMTKTGVRVIKKTISRYIAIVLIIALGAGFFTGLKVTSSAMIKTCDNYLHETNMYDARIISTLGWSPEDEEKFQKIDGVKEAQASISRDFIAVSGGNEIVLKAHEIPSTINLPQLVSGRMPSQPDECVVDSYALGGLGEKGGTITVSTRNDDETKDFFAYDEYKVVGTVRSSLYINFERGGTALSNGVVTGFVYMMDSAFDIERYTDMYLTYDKTGYVYSDEYNDAVADMKEKVEQAAADASHETAEDLKEKAYEEALSQAPKEFMLLPPETAKQMIEESLPQVLFEEPKVYVLGRAENVGYTCYRSDADIVDGIAAVFPLFFFAVAALVCLTTMNRMVTDDRTKIGVLKSLGYGRARIMTHYLFYAGSAGVLGCTIGVFAGSIIFPKAIWQAYSIMYSMPDIALKFDVLLMILSSVGYLVIVLAVTWSSCRRELLSPAAELIRPKAPAAGRRVLLEKIGFIWKKLKFLHKVSIRNVFRYRKRFIMMNLGIGGCTALLITGFGLNDSISHIADRQFDEITFYDCSVNFAEDMTGSESDFIDEYSDEIDSCVFLFNRAAVCRAEDVSADVTLLGVDDFEGLNGMIDFHLDGKKLDAPQKGGCIISKNLAESCGLKTGETLNLNVDDKYDINLEISGIYENVIYNYVYTTKESLAGFLPEDNVKLAYINFKESLDVHEASAELAGCADITNISITDDMHTRVNSMLDSMKYIVILVIACAAALDFIVLFNLTNINILERIREIATIKVLGFREGETAHYVFRENLIMTFCGCILGIPLGIALHEFVMSKIKIELIAFESIRTPITYIVSIILTFVFTYIVNLIMMRRLRIINMAEALKSVE